MRGRMCNGKPQLPSPRYAGERVRERGISISLRARRHAGRSHWAVLVFLVGFALLLSIVCSYYLLPAADAARNADAAGKHQIAAYSRLLLTIVLFILFVGLTFTFRIGRFFFPRASDKRTTTQYVDAWSESGKRLKSPPP